MAYNCDLESAEKDRLSLWTLMYRTFENFNFKCLTCNDGFEYSSLTVYTLEKLLKFFPYKFITSKIYAFLITKIHEQNFTPVYNFSSASTLRLLNQQFSWCVYVQNW